LQINSLQCKEIVYTVILNRKQRQKMVNFTGTKTAIEQSIFWQRQVYAKSKNPVQKARCLAAIGRLEAQIVGLAELTTLLESTK
jgi:chorismate-pyruvate lyase